MGSFSNLGQEAFEDKMVKFTELEEEYLVESLACGRFTLNEVRELLDLQPMRNGDTSMNPDEVLLVRDIRRHWSRK